MTLISRVSPLHFTVFVPAWSACDQVIREDPAAVRSCRVRAGARARARGRGTETSAEVLVGPPWRMDGAFTQVSGDTENRPANRGTETSAEALVGPPWRMESNAGQQQWY